MQRKIGFWEAFSIGIGGMIGRGIFAVLGLSIKLSKGTLPISFFLAGIIALLIGELKRRASSPSISKVSERERNTLSP